MRHSVYLSAFLWIAIAIWPSSAHAGAPPPAITAVQPGKELRVVERERDIALINEKIVQSELKRLETQSSIFQTWLGVYGILLVLLVGLFGFFTYRDAKRVAVEEARKTASEEAARVARSEVQQTREDIERIKNEAADLLQQIQGHEAKARELSENVEKQLYIRPDADQPAADLTAVEQGEVDRTAEEIRGDEPRNWSIKDLKILMLESRSNKDWKRLLQDAEALYLLHRNDKSARSDALFWKSWALDELTRYEEAGDSWKHYLTECADCGNANKAAAYTNWGLSLVRLARTKKGAESVRYFLDTCEKYAQAVAIEPAMAGTWYNWGIALAELARLKTGKESERYYRESFEKYARAVEIDPDMHSGWYNWGCTLADLGKTKEGAESDDIFREAEQKYARATAIAPDKQEAWFNWSLSLERRAKRASGAAQRELYGEALEKARRAQALPPHDAQNVIDRIEAVLAKEQPSGDASQA